MSMEIIEVDKTVRELEAIMKKEIEYYQNVISLMKTKRKALAEINLEEIKKITQEEEKIVKEVKALTSQRIELIKNLANLIRSPKSNLKDIIKLLPPSYGNVLKPLRIKLIEIAKEVKRINRMNEEVIRSALSHVARFFDKLAEAQTTSRYTPSGMVKGKISIIEKEV